MPGGHGDRNMNTGADLTTVRWRTTAQLGLTEKAGAALTGAGAA
jgi:hypothetical protein